MNDQQIIIQAIQAAQAQTQAHTEAQIALTQAHTEAQIAHLRSEVMAELKEIKSTVLVIADRVISDFEDISESTMAETVRTGSEVAANRDEIIKASTTRTGRPLEGKRRPASLAAKSYVEVNPEATPGQIQEYSKWALGILEKVLGFKLVTANHPLLVAFFDALAYYAHMESPNRRRVKL